MTTLAIDLGGTKTLAALVRDGQVIEARRILTRRGEPAGVWLDEAARLAEGWRGRFDHAAVAVSGLVRGGAWSAINHDVLPVPAGFPLVGELQRRINTPVHALNDAQAAAWGEFRFGAGRDKDFVFLTISTGIGGGVVTGGRLLTGRGGVAGHVGRLPVGAGTRAPTIEDVASGQAIARRAAPYGATDAEAVLAAASVGTLWAQTLVSEAVSALAGALVSLQAVLDPDLIVIGGGVGLAPGFLDRLRGALSDIPDVLRPTLAAASLGPEAGLVGVADHARHTVVGVS